ncbi:hypothetical protein Droror1_Dr00000878 [Drosera rotundifolia]
MSLSTAPPPLLSSTPTLNSPLPQSTTYPSPLPSRKEKRLFGVWAVAAANGGEAERKCGVELKVEEEEGKERWSESTLPDRFRPPTRLFPCRRFSGPGS